MMNDNDISILKLFKIVIQQALREGRTRYILFILLVFIGSFEMFFALRIPEMITNISYDFYSGNTSNFLETIMPLIIFVVVLLVFQILKNINAIMGVRVGRDLRSEFEIGLIEKVSKLKWEDFENHEFEMKMDMVNHRGANGYLHLAKDLVVFLITSIMYIIVYIYIVSRLSMLIAIIFLLASIIYYVVGFYFGNKLYKSLREYNHLHRKRNYIFHSGENKTVHQDTLVNRLYGHLTSSWRKLNNEYLNISIKASNKVRMYTLIPNLIFALIAGWLLYVVIIEIQQGRQEVGYFGLIIGTIISYKMTMQNLTLNVQWNRRDVNIYKDYLYVANREQEQDNTEKYLSDEFNIKFEDVSYTYLQAERKALNRLNISIRSHETIAIVGVNGSGKTTFVNLLMELTKRYDGLVRVNGKNVNEETGILKNSASCIFQDFAEYQLTIKENIQLGNINRVISNQEIDEILLKVGLFDFVNALPDKENTVLGQINKGTELSKGQWQRLSVARLLANEKAKIWILDEPTAYLDPIAEIEMYEFIYSLKENRTVIFISHRLGFAKRADRIVVFDEGHLIENGTHLELLRNEKSEYSKMYLKQKKWYE